MKKAPTKSPEKLPGSQRQRQRAKRVLSCAHVGGSFWRVWGGENEHIVKKENGGYLCDCKIMMEKQNTICSHIVKIKMESGDFPQ